MTLPNSETHKIAEGTPDSSTELSDQDRYRAVQILTTYLDGKDLRAVVEESVGRRQRGKSVEWIVAEAEHSKGRLSSRLSDADLPQFLVDLRGVELLSSRVLRTRLAEKASPDVLDQLYQHVVRYGHARGRTGRPSRAKAIGEIKWTAGKTWAQHFVRTLGFPLAFAGLTGIPPEPETETIKPFRPLDPLADFQEELKDKSLEVLSGTRTRRAILTLPTGAGKTRTAVEALVTWLLAEPARRGVLWIAQSEELCEQAVQAFTEVWTDLGHRDAQVRKSLTISRLWATRSVPSEADVVVASIQKLHAICRGDDDRSLEAREDLQSLAGTIGVVVVDEAHRILGPSYKEVLNVIGLDALHPEKSDIVLLGLTATPGRANHEETRTLIKEFRGVLLSPECLGDDPVGELRRRKVLSTPVHTTIDYGAAAKSPLSTAAYREYFDTFRDIHPEILRELGQEQRRNKRLLDQLLNIPEDWPTLFFGCSVEHAQAIAVLLNRKGRRAAVVTGETRSATRRALIEEFRGERLSVLCNYGVLTTGFDAPKVRALVIGRPTLSAVLYEQMIGRGMRGPEFGGTDECLVVDVEDNLQFEGQMAFARYREYWSREAS